jgi:hypothetical protein
LAGEQLEKQSRLGNNKGQPRATGAVFHLARAGAEPGRATTEIGALFRRIGGGQAE